MLMLMLNVDLDIDDVVGVGVDLDCGLSPEIVVHLGKALLYSFVHRSWRELGLHIDPEEKY